MKTKSTKRVDEYRTDVTLHLIRIGGDIEHIKEDMSEVKEQLTKINGRVRETESSITAIKAIGSTITVVIGVILTWLGIDKG
tara:strand:- start:26052 stop:26297 length:246 start_codon:yes stop_codon:yes gene_type:complete